MTISSKVAGSVCDAMPVNQPGKSSLKHSFGVNFLIASPSCTPVAPNVVDLSKFA